jgi:hypothetical protein
MAVVTITTDRTCPRRRRAITGPRVEPTLHPVHPAVAAGRACPQRRAGRSTYLRRRLTAVVLVLAAVLATAQAGAALGGSPHEAPGRAPAVAEVVVEPGDSLWSVAERLAPGEDPRPVVDALADARRGAPLLPGETIRWDG